MQRSYRKSPTRDLVIAGLLLAIGLILPYVVHMFGEQAGIILDPMDLPVLLCGLILGWRWGLGLGIILPLLSGFLTGMPPLFPVAVAMAFQLGAQGFITGILRGKINNFITVLIADIIAGILFAVVMGVLLGIAHHHFGIIGPLIGTFVKGLPGIIIQIIIIPIIAIALKKAGVYNGRN